MEASGSRCELPRDRAVSIGALEQALSKGHRLNPELPLDPTTAGTDRRANQAFVLICKNVSPDTEPRLAMGYSCFNNQGREP